MRTLNSIPGLKSKLDRVGGIDGIVGPRDRFQPPLSMNYSIDGRSRPAFNSSGSGSSLSSVGGSGPAGSGPPSIADLYESVRGKLAQDPAMVRKKLDDASRSPEQIDALIMLGSRAAYQEPDLASLALEAATKLIPQVEPLQKRASVFQSLMRAAHTCDGEVDGELLQQGLDIVRQLREEEAARASASPASGPTPPGRMTGLADQLEMAIVAELALQNFSGAMRYVRLMPEEMKLQALLRIVQTLVQSY
jgi:hypothetical protein